ncbi:hypothetical protein F5ESL0233_03085 [Lactobacillus sp. ESL0233]|uniref:hypothetical protein n=1 Tax=Lactobacillus sp. ESL0233 TaxID=2069354 RepID=UPI000EFAA2E0|nr:hypothetical protein [Lactobacillus sp. ESL0233]RMC41324.1 hypothetical protein F5ESL0233_03085 [Lactobacillus sp. ESL0233]
MKFKKILKALAATLMFTVTGMVFSSTVQAKYVGHNATPTELRGNWYAYKGHNKWTHIKITKHAFIYDGKVSCSLNKKGTQKLHVMRYKQNGRPYYDMNKSNYHYQEIGSFWLSRSKVQGRRVMKSYYNMGYFTVYTRNKIKHDYSYEVKGAGYMQQIGK